MLYGGGVWGKSTSANASNNKLFNWFLRCALGVKSSTSNLVTVGECGQIPPSVIAHMNILCYDAKLKGLSESWIAKQVYNELCRMNCCGFLNWVTHVRELARTYDLHNYSGEATEFKVIAQVYRLSTLHCQMTRYSQRVPGCVSQWNLFWQQNQPIRLCLSNQVRHGRKLFPSPLGDFNRLFEGLIGELFKIWHWNMFYFF